MGFNNGYDSGYSDAIEDVRNGRVPGLEPTAANDGAAKKKYSVVRMAGWTGSSISDFSDEDVLSVTPEDLGVDSKSDEPQTMDFNRIADKLAPVVMLDIFWNVSTGTVYVQGPEGYDWQQLEDNVSPGGAMRIVLAASGEAFIQM